MRKGTVNLIRLKKRGNRVQRLSARATKHGTGVRALLARAAARNMGAFLETKGSLRTWRGNRPTFLYSGNRRVKRAERRSTMEAQVRRKLGLGPASTGRTWVKGHWRHGRAR